MKKLFENEMGKFLYSDLNSDIRGYETGILMLVLAMIRVKKAIELMPFYQKKKEFADQKLENFRK